MMMMMVMMINVGLSSKTAENQDEWKSSK